ncbi:hypothetical protein GY45DRAFT_292413 [Cubamyces sp. BRFM 1775]|nr:hypothetical protein GY45DRAFT_292413 [Cubamyces sp. BRFM 1775]
MRNNIRILAAVQTHHSIPESRTTSSRTIWEFHSRKQLTILLRVMHRSWRLQVTEPSTFHVSDSDCLCSDCVHESPRSRCHSYTVPPREPKRQRTVTTPLIMTPSLQSRLSADVALSGTPSKRAALRQTAYGSPHPASLADPPSNLPSPVRRESPGGTWTGANKVRLDHDASGTRSAVTLAPRAAVIMQADRRSCLICA